MYVLEVFHAGSRVPTETVRIDRPAEALATIRTLLQKHADCESVVVLMEGVRLFTVNGKGNRLKD